MPEQHVIDLDSVQAEQLYREGWRPCELPFDAYFFWDKVSTQPDLVGEKLVSALTNALEAAES